jgi:apolipoprotein N-acyltransferase
LATALAWGMAMGSQTIILAIIWLAVYASYRKLGKRGLLLAPVWWVLGVWFLNQQPLGLPWGFLTYTQAGLPLCRDAVFHLTFWGFESLMILVNVLITLGEGRWILFFILAFCFPTHEDNSVYQSLQPVAIQGNLSIEAERLYVNQNDRNTYYQNLIQKALKQYPQTKLILLPEGVLTEYWPFQTPIPLLAGGIYAVDHHYYNGALLFQNQKPLQYMAKRILVPFGETTPFIPDTWMQAWLKLLGVEYSLGFQAGSWDQKPLKLENIKIGPLICFEALYPTLTQRYRQQSVKLLVTFSNLGWYHQHPMLEQQFLAINQIRAAETHTPLILVTNTGVSAFIDNRGRILSRASSGSLKLFKFNDDNSL